MENNNKREDLLEEMYELAKEEYAKNGIKFGSIIGLTGLLDDEQEEALEEMYELAKKSSLGYMSIAKEELKEYFRLNIKDFYGYENKNVVDIVDPNGERENYITEYIEFDDRTEKPYALFKMVGNSRYCPKTPIDIKEAIDSGEEVIGLDINPGYLVKQFVNSKGAFFEWYDLKGRRNQNKFNSIRTEIYDFNEYHDAIDNYNLGGERLTTKVITFVNCLMGNKTKYIVDIFQGTGYFLIELTDVELGVCIDVRVITQEEGMTLYSVYNDYMIEKGYFTDKNNKVNKK